MHCGLSKRMQKLNDKFQSFLLEANCLAYFADDNSLLDAVETFNYEITLASFFLKTLLLCFVACVEGSLETAANIYFDLLTCTNPRVSYAAKSALIKLLRMKPEQAASNTATMARSSSKMSETPPSTRSASPPSFTSSNKVLICSLS